MKTGPLKSRLGLVCIRIGDITQDGFREGIEAIYERTFRLCQAVLSSRGINISLRV